MSVGTGSDGRIPLTVIGGYLGAGKTTVLNRLLADPGGRRTGVIVNDFGSVGIDAELLARAGNDGVVNLPNGCACCTVGDDLHQALQRLVVEGEIDHVVVEVSGVADPAAVAAWSTVDPFEPGGVIVLADAESVRDRAADRYVGGEVLRQLVGADLILVTKVDRCDASTVDEIAAWLDHAAPGVPHVPAVHGDIPTEVLLGIAPTAGAIDHHPVDAEHADRYEAWDWTTDQPLDRTRLVEFLDSLPDGILRLKGWVALTSGNTVEVNVVGRSCDVRAADPATTTLVAISLRGTADPFRSGSKALT